MKIKSIYGENFKAHEKLNLILDDKKTQVFVGKNGKGKSSAIDMIKYAITGELPENPFNMSAAYMNVEVKLAEGTTFTRGKVIGKNAKVTVHGKNATAKGLNDLISRNTGVPFDVMKIISSEDVIDNMKPEELSNLLMSYVPEELDVEKIIAFSESMDPKIINELKIYFPKMPETFSVKGVKEAYQAVYDVRKSVKSVIDDRKSNLKIFNGNIPSKTMEQVDSELEDIIKKETAQKEYKKIKNLYDRAEESLKIQEKEISRLKKEITSITTTRPNADIERELKEKEKELLDEIASNKMLITNLQTSKTTYANLLQDLNCDTCPLCEEIKCTTDKTSYKNEIKENLDATIEGIELLRIKKEKNEKKLEDVRKGINAYIEQVNSYNNKILLVKQLDNLERTKISLPEKPTAIMDATDYTEIKRKLKDEQEKIFTYEQNLKIQHELELYTEKYNLYKELVELLSAKGTIMNNIVEYYLSVYEDVCNEIADRINLDFKIKFEAKDGVKISFIKSGSKYPVPYESISSGEKALVMFVIIYMLNTLSGFKILIMDNLDKLDSDAFAAMLKVVMSKEVQDEFDHIILSCVDHEDTMKELDKYPDLKIVLFK